MKRVKHTHLVCRLKPETKEMPAAPANLHQRIMRSITEDERDAGDQNLQDIWQPNNAMRWMSIVAAILLALSVYAFLRSESPRPKSDTAAGDEPVVLVMNEFQSIIPDPAIGFGQVSGSIMQAFESPYETEFEDLSKDLENATRFLLTRLESTIPSNMAPDN